MSSFTKVYTKFIGNSLYSDLIILLFLFIISFFIRIWDLSTNLFFGPEQGTAFLEIKNIVLNHHLTLIGAKTDVTGIFHGPIYYYVAAIPFFLSNGNPLYVAYFLIFINCTSIFFIYLIGRNLFNRQVGLISSILFSISFLAVIYPRWLGTNPLGIPFSSLFFLLFIYFLQNKKWFLLPASIVFGLLTQSEFLNLLFYSVIVIILFICYFRHFKKQNFFYLLSCFLIAAVFSIGPFFLFDIRHQFIITKNVLLLIRGGSGYHISFISSLIVVRKVLTNFLGELIFPIKLLLGFWISIISLIFLVCWQFNKDRKFWVLPIWILIPPLILTLLHQNVLFQYFVTIIPAIIITVAFSIDWLSSRMPVTAYGLLILLIVVNIRVIKVDIPKNKNIFFQSTQPNLKYSDEISVIKKIYITANHKPFAIQTFTIPYWSQQGWQYLFWYYGLSRYGYLPIAQQEKTLFVILQANPSDPIFENNWLRTTVSTWGIQKQIFAYGTLKVLVLKVPDGKY